MKVKCYRSKAYNATDIYDVESISCVADVDEMTDSDREMLRGDCTPMLLLKLKSGSLKNLFVPPHFIIWIK